MGRKRITLLTSHVWSLVSLSLPLLLTSIIYRLSLIADEENDMNLISVTNIKEKLEARTPKQFIKVLMIHQSTQMLLHLHHMLKNQDTEWMKNFVHLKDLTTLTDILNIKTKNLLTPTNNTPFNYYQYIINLIQKKITFMIHE